MHFFILHFMNYLELCIETDPELAEAISEAIYPHVEGGVALEQVRDWPMETEWKADADGWMVDAEGNRQSPINDENNPVKVLVRGYLPQDDTLEARRIAVEQALGYLNMIRPIPMPTYKEVKQEDWAEAWKVAFKPLRIGRRVLIRPSWVDQKELDVRPDDIVLALDPGLAFGTGLHPTTQMCAMALEERLQPGQSVLDVGCGSGILSVLAKKMGAGRVDGVDTDPEAVRATLENAQVNGVGDGINVAQGSWDAAPQTQPYDVLIANILAPVIIKLLGAGMGRMGKLFIFSGILDTQADAVIEAIKNARLAFVERKTIQDWVCLVAIKN